MNGDIYYRSRSVFCSFCKRTIEAFTTRAIAAKTFLCTATDRIVICVNYISLDSRGFLDTVSLHYYNELSSFLGKFRLHGRVLDLVYENLATSRYKPTPIESVPRIGRV